MSTNGDAPPVEEVVERLLATDDLPDELHGIRRKAREYGGGLEETRVEIWERLPIAFRLEVLSAETVHEFDFEVESAYSLGIEFDVGADVIIQNEGGLVQYDSETHQYHEYDFEPPEDQAGHTTSPTLIGSSPLTNYDVTYDGTDTVAGRETHVLTFRPTEDAEWFNRGFDYVTTWVDGTYWFPLKHETAYDLRDGELLQVDTDEDLQGERYFQTQTFEEIEFDTGIEDSKFHLPADAHRVE